MKDNKGFTLVELLAVIVILAIIMIIAIPSVLQTMTTAQQKSFMEYFEKVYTTGDKTMLESSTLGLVKLPSRGFFLLDITKDLGLASTGSYKGYYVIRTVDGYKMKYVVLYNEEYGMFYSSEGFDTLPELSTIITEEMIAKDAEHDSVLGHFYDANDSIMMTKETLETKLSYQGSGLLNENVDYCTALAMIRRVWNDFEDESETVIDKSGNTYTKTSCGLTD